MIAASCCSTRAGAPEAAMRYVPPPAMASRATALNTLSIRAGPPRTGVGLCAAVRRRPKSGSGPLRARPAANFMPAHDKRRDLANPAVKPGSLLAPGLDLGLAGRRRVDLRPLGHRPLERRAVAAVGRDLV